MRVLMILSADYWGSLEGSNDSRDQSIRYIDNASPYICASSWHLIQVPI
jgi:hypothetical protein